MGNCIFPMVNAWTSKKPVKYWRAFTPKDIPLDNDKPKLYFEWCDLTKSWQANIIAPIQRHWSINNIKKAISIHNRLIQGGIQETVIVEVHPKFEIGKYKNNIEVLNIYSENSQFNRNRHDYKIYETEYYIKHNNQVDIVTESRLDNMVNQDRNCYVYSFQKGNNLFLHVKSNTINPKKEKAFIINALSKPGLKFNFEHHPSFSYNSKENEWKYVNTTNISRKLWKLSKDKIPTIEHILETKTDHMHFTFISFREYYKGQITKIKSSTIKDDLDLAFLKAVQTKSTKTASFHRRGAGSTHKNPIEKPQVKNSVKREKPEFVYILYKNNQQKTIAKKCLKEYAEKLADRHPLEIKILTVADIKTLYPTKTKDKKEVEHPDGMFNRRIRRMSKQKNRRYSKNVKVQRIYVPIRESEENPKVATEPWKNKNGHEHKAVFINKNNIQGAVIKVNGELVEKDSVKLIYHDVSRLPKHSVTRHDLKKQLERSTKEGHSTINKQDILKELQYKYGSYDRRYTVNSDVEKWSLQFFIVLKMIKDKERRKKVFNYLKKCGYSNEFIIGFIQYLHLTKNGDPTREHKRNLPIRHRRIMVTKPHIQIISPDPRMPVVIEHEIKDEDNGGVKNIITEDVSVRYNKKQGMRFFKYDKETNEHILISSAKDVKKWAYVHEYKGDSNTTKWHDLVSVTTKEVPKVEKIPFHIERKVKGGKIKKWSSPIPQEKTVRYIIKKLNILYKEEKYDLLYSLIYNTVMEYYRTNSSLYDAIRFALYHNYTDLSKHIVTLIKVNKMDDPDLVIFMEDLLHPH